MNWFHQMGLYGWPLLLLAIVVAVLIIVRGVQARGSRANDPGLRNGLNSILFWGAIAALIGFLGQYHGMYNGLNAIAAADELSPFVIARGLAQSFTSVIFGLTTFLFAALAWFVLGAAQRRRIGNGGVK